MSTDRYDPGPIGLGEIVRRLERIERKLDDGLFVRAETHDQIETANQERFKALAEFQSRLTWGIILAFIGLLAEGLVILMRLVIR